MSAFDRTFRFNVPPQRRSEALLEVAIQARTPLGGDLGACRGRSVRLQGVMSLEAALNVVLADSGCDYAHGPNRSIVIRRASVRAAAPTARPIPAPPAPPEVMVTQLSDVIVTAERRTGSPQSASSAITALSDAQIEDAGAEGANGLSALIAGMTVTNLGSGRNKILLRGMSDGAFTGQTQSTVGIYFNRSPLTYSAPDPDLKLVDLDRVEVLRGPQGALYGTGPIGGIVRIVPMAPDTVNEQLEMSASLSKIEGGGQNTDFSLMANAPLPGQAGAIRGVVYAEENGGYLNDASQSRRHVNSGQRRGGRLAASLNLGGGWTLSAGGIRQRIETEDTHYVHRTSGGHKRSRLVREPHDNDFREVHLSVEGTGDWGSLETTLSRVNHDFTSRYDASAGLAFFGSHGLIGALDDAKRINLTIFETVYSSPQQGRLRWLAGVFASTGETRSDAELWTLWPYRELTYTEERQDERYELAVFGEAGYDLTPSLNLAVGGRYYRGVDRTRSLVRQGTETRPFDGEGEDRGFSPRVTLAYQPIGSWSYYAQVARGHRAGGFNTAGPIEWGFEGKYSEPEQFYSGDVLWNYEIGAKGLLWNGRVQTRVALFHADWTDIQSDQFLPSGLVYAVNVGDGVNTGLELETNWRLTSELELKANALISRPKLTQPSFDFDARPRTSLPGVPAVSANVHLNWKRQIGPDLIVFSSANVAYVGPSRLTFDAEPRNKMGDYVTGRISAGLAMRRWRLTAYVDNPFNTSANTFAFGDPFSLPEALTTTPIRPRTGGVILSWRPGRF
ncbi:TonB-dependent receptor [Brevundimonas diminuta]|uniref:TonB-dependent receptor n=1 Tax=Brevundimonas diminuta TaxID=293 RepID=UPI003209D063